MKTHLPLRPPVCDDADKDYQAHLIYYLAWTWIISSTCLKLIEIPFVPGHWLREVIIILAVDANGLTALLLNRQKKPELASILFPGVLWLIITTSVFTSGGIHSPVIVAYLPIVLCTGLLRGGRAGIMMAASSIISVLVMIILELTHQMPATWIVLTSFISWLIYSTFFLQVSAIQYWLAVRISASFETITLETGKRKRVEMRLRESEFSYRMIAENRILGVCWLSPDGFILRNNATLSQTLGYAPGELRGVHFGNLTHPDDLVHEIELLHKIQNREIDNYLIEKRVKHKSGNYFWIELNRTAFYDPANGAIDFYIAIIQNIEQRKEAEAALKLSEERYRALVDNAVEALVVMDVRKGTFVRFSESALQLFKITREELYKKGPTDLSPEYQPNGRLSSEMAKEKLFEAENGGKPVFEWMHCDMQGNPIPTEVRLVRLPSANGIIIRGSIIDITERKKVEAELNLAYQHLNYLVENTPLAVIEFDKDLFIKRWSKRAEEIFGWSAQEVLGKNVNDPDFRIVYAEDEKAVDKVNLELMQGTVKSNVSMNRNNTKAGAVIYSEWYNSVLKDAYGNVISILSLVHNVTERKKAEEELNLAYQQFNYLVENTPLAVVEYDKDMNIKRWSKRAEEIFGWSAAEVLGKNVYDPGFPIIYTEDLKAVNKITDELMEGKSNLSLNRNYTKSGAIIYSEWYNSVLKDAHGNVISILSLAHNVTERKEAEESLKETNERLRQLSSHLQTVREEERTRIAREIHDELGQQLTALKMDTSWFKNEMPAGNQSAHEKAAAMLALIDDTITTVNKISSNLRPSVLDNLGLQAALEWQSSEFESRTGIKGYLLIKAGDYIIDKDISTCVFRVYQEALTNIIRHSQANEAHTTFEIKDNFITLEIRDNGMGFDIHELDRKKNFGLTGMEERAHMFDGELKIESLPGKGTIITLKIPFTPQPEKLWD